MSLFTAVVFITTLFGCLASTPQNVARGKTAVQSSIYAGQYKLPPNNSVDGDISSDTSKLAHTDNSTGSNWWRVDLGREYNIGKVIIFSTDAETTRDLSKVYILTANEGSSSPPSPNNTNWDIVYYIEPVLSEREEITLYLTTPYRHLAVYREKGNIITREVEVYNWIGAENPQTLTQTASQSSTFYNGTEAAIAIDRLIDMRGDFGTYSSTKSTNTTVSHWWRVSLKESCTNCYVRLYPYLRPRRFGDDGFSRLASITVLSSSLDHSTPSSPSLNSDQWNSCYNFAKAHNGPIIDSCSYQNIKFIAVYRNTVQGLELVEVEVFHSVEDAFSSTSLTAESSSCVKMTWSIKLNHFISYFKFSCTGKSAQNISSTVSEYTQCGYLPHEEAVCEIEAIGFGSKVVEQKTRTHCKVPTVADFTLSDKKTMVDERERRQITVIISSGGKPNCESADLTVKLLKENGELVPDQIVTGLSGQVMFDDLDAVMIYRVKVSATNNVGNESAPVEKSNKTGEVAPYTGPDKFTATPTDSCVALRWEKPSQPNGDIINYTYICDVWNGTRQNTINAPVTKATVCDLRSATRVNCSITARNSEGVSPAATLSVFTLFKYNLPPVEAKLSENQIEGQINVVVSLPEFQNTIAEILYYQFIVEKVRNVENSRRKRSSGTTSGVDLDLLFNYTIAESINLPYYVAGQLSPPVGSDTIRFDYGTEEISDEFDNRRLETGVSYKTHYKFIVKLGETETPQFIRGKKTFEAYIPPQNNTKIPIIVGSVIAVVVVASVIIIITVIYIRKRRTTTKHHNSDRDHTVLYDGERDGEARAMIYLDVQPNTVANQIYTPLVPPSTELDLNETGDYVNQYNEYTPTSDIHIIHHVETSPSANYVNTNLLPNHMISANRQSFQQYVNNGRNNITSQFKELEAMTNIEMTRTVRPGVSKKNGREGIHPGDSTGVKMISTPVDCDYINATFIDGYNRSNRFIAASSPPTNTVDSFWLMIWQQKARTIVNITCEGGGEQYWPVLGRQHFYGAVSVACVAEETFPDYRINTLHVSKGEEIIIIHHYQYHYLPQHGEPSTISFVQFHHKISDRLEQNSVTDENSVANLGPCVVHCSEGAGPTGTFIALDNLLEQAKAERELDVFDCVRLMRARRPAMVQTAAQYLFVHEAILEAITSADFCMSKKVMNDKISEYRKTKGGRILEEYMVIVEGSEKFKHDYSSGEAVINHSYNYSQNILPDENYRPYLEDSDTDYINAVLINGTRVQNQYICTQSPLPTTLKHFWSMIYNHGVSTIIITQSCQARIIQGDEFTVGKYRVIRTQVTDQETIPTTTLNISCKNERTVKVTVFDMTEIWSDENSYVEWGYCVGLYESVDKWLAEINNFKVTVVCRDGATRCGLVVSMFNILDNFRTEQRRDVYSSVKMSKSRRPQFISTVDDYEFLYTVLRGYADEDDAYTYFD